MLIKFDSKVGTLTMFGEPALQLIRMMGHSGTVPSAILAAALVMLAFFSLGLGLILNSMNLRLLELEKLVSRGGKTSLRA